MEVSEALLKRRTIRRFTQEKLDEKELEKLLEYARLAAYPSNMQPLKFAIITKPELLEKVFPNTKWAGYLPETGTPKDGERPVAYIAVLGDKSIKQSFEVEAGAAVTSMMLGAFDMGIASCWLGAIDRKKLMQLFNLPEEKFDLLYLLALGYPAQKSDICEAKDNIKYFELPDGQISVPKRSLDEITIKID
ncbi:MAG: nitroreductase family protein [Clostridia bacterium]|nr:nitroreductase family protein [Clostridia bacterium]